MPTPFYHLSIAEEILTWADLPGSVSSWLGEYRAEFLFGNTAPDVQTLSGQDRRATHFFDLPISPNQRTAWARMLEEQPFLAEVDRLPAGQAAFIAGYLCHLLADWKWVLEIFAPIFGPNVTWSHQRHRSYLHNVLRSHLDLTLRPGLNPQIAGQFSAARPNGWLSFVRDQDLVDWRDYLAGQLCTGCEAQTVEVFAARQGIPPDDFYRLLNSEDELQKHIFSRLPRQRLQTYRQQLVVESVDVVKGYLN